MFTQRGFRALALLAVIGFAARTWATDSDQDGVEDDVDVCCETPSGVAVDAEGRPIGDRDEDCDTDLADYQALFFDLGEPGSGMVDLRGVAAFQNGFSGTLSPGGPCCAAALDPLDDGTGLPPGGIPGVIISEIKPGEHIEVYNTTESTVDLSAVAWQWCAPFQYATVATAVSVPAGGFAVLDWPSPTMTNPTETNGEMILYEDFFFCSDSSVLDFVCWGSPSPSRRLAQGAGSGKWTGLCAPSIPSGGAIHRIAGTDGTSAASYDVTAPPSPMTCAP